MYGYQVPVNEYNQTWLSRLLFEEKDTLALTKELAVFSRVNCMFENEIHRSILQAMPGIGFRQPRTRAYCVVGCGDAKQLQ